APRTIANPNSSVTRMRNLALILLSLLAACNFVGRSASAPTGDFRFERVGDTPAPAEFPPGSGAFLEDGTLAIDDEGRFSLRFYTLGAQEVEPVWTVQEGSYTVEGDSLFFT